MATTTENIIQSVERYGNRLFRFIRGRVRSNEDAEDILQEVWFQLSRVADLDAIESVSGWLYQVARSRIVDRSRKRREWYLEDTLPQDDNDEAPVLADLLSGWGETPEDTYFRNLFWEELFKALEELPEQQRAVFVKNELEDMTLQAIADETNEPLKTIISRKRYAVLFLRRRLEELYTELVA